LEANTKQSIRSITLIAMLLAVLVVQEYVLTGIPQIQLTVILILVYAQFLPYQKLLPLVIAYTLLDNLLLGSFNVLYTPTMLIIWPLYAVIARSLRHKADYIQLIFAVIFSFVYGWSFLPASILVQHLDTWQKIWTYMKLDFIAELVMAMNTLVTFLLFYQPLMRLLDFLFKRTFPNQYGDNQMSL